MFSHNHHLDGKSTHGIESTILKYSHSWQLLKQGLDWDWKRSKLFVFFCNFFAFYYCNILESIFPDRLVNEIICTHYCYTLGF